ncbi:DUF3043 domain-containing protein [Corynebacterium hindlerae]|uniref:DUF3043 domain-containing protein n=1 Tax=Corynebacterium hindlerae TaxID=699041 RepID=A0A7G5FEE2_9CORY|nr:DUF3043 domain-containing protein [Corynebacterium hindlerae]QMV84983.1 DUF3043 domain-containing protein [Corynebacterium hindlerae]
MSTPDNEKLPKGYTPKKGRPTPKRNEVERARGVRRGPATPAETRQEMKAREKALKESMTKQEWKEYKKKQREERNRRAKETQAAMDRGDERYLLPRDKGPVRAFVRDWVDARRFFSELVMPVALLLLIVMFIGQSYPQIAATLSMIAMVIMVLFFVEGIFIGRRANKAVREKFPDTTETGFGLGFYAYSRASQLRKLRTPKPRVAVGEK